AGAVAPDDAHLVARHDGEAGRLDDESTTHFHRERLRLEHPSRLRSWVVTATTGSRPLRWPALAAPLACGCCLAAGAAYVAVDDPSDGGAFLPCPFRTLTGWWCPGCGLTRATHHLLRGDVVQAHRYNVLVLAVLTA